MESKPERLKKIIENRKSMLCFIHGKCKENYKEKKIERKNIRKEKVKINKYIFKINKLFHMLFWTHFTYFPLQCKDYVNSFSKFEHLRGLWDDMDDNLKYVNF